MVELLEKVIQGDCLSILDKVDKSSVDMVYLDPPFFTNKKHSSINRDRTKKFSFADVWAGFEEYAEFMEKRLYKLYQVLKDTGSIFVHCDTSANFIIRALLDNIFGPEQFRSEIIWTYKRWSNSAKGLMPAHQTIFFYSKTKNFKFNQVYNSYSETTNIDQILQLRARDKYGVSKYATDDDGNIVFSSEKKGVPLSDVWEIPFLNPKAKERVGYPTQKPILLLERIIEISTDPSDLVLDPFCGSGTTLVAAKLLGRQALGIDISPEAIALSKKRLASPTKTESALLQKGRDSYLNVSKDALSILSGLEVIPVQRNNGIDAFIKNNFGFLVPIRVQKADETIFDAANKLAKAATSKKAYIAILVRTQTDNVLFPIDKFPDIIKIVDSTSLSVSNAISNLLSENNCKNTLKKSFNRYIKDFLR